MNLPELGLSLAALHAGLPWLVHQRLGLAVASRVRGGRGELALTFDDGPDPKTTPKVLEALEAAGVRATFFVLEPKARKHPELLRELLAASHEVALHGRVHRHAWLKNPLSLLPELKSAKAALEDLTGTQIRHYRPPHGGWTWPLLYAVRRLELVPVQWEIEAGDWQKDTTPEWVKDRVLGQVRPGSIVVMHDAGPGGRVSGEALSLLLPGLLARGYRPAPLKDLAPVIAGFRELPPKLLSPVENAFARIYHVEPAFYGAHSVFRLGPARLPIDLPGFARGTPAAEIHMDSERARRAREAGTYRAFRAVRDSMHDLARAARERPVFQKAEVFFANTIFWEALEPLGFQAVPLPPAFARRIETWSHFLHRMYGGLPLRRVEARLAFIPRSELIRRYGEA